MYQNSSPGVLCTTSLMCYNFPLECINYAKCSTASYVCCSDARKSLQTSCITILYTDTPYQLSIVDLNLLDINQFMQMDKAEFSRQVAKYFLYSNGGCMKVYMQRGGSLK